jgi:hypothetical protein
MSLQPSLDSPVEPLSPLWGGQLEQPIREFPHLLNKSQNGGRQNNLRFTHEAALLI